MFRPNLKFVALPVPEIIGGTRKFGSVTSARPTTARATTARGQLLAVTIARQDNCARRVLLGRQLLAVNSAVNSAVIVSAMC